MLSLYGGQGMGSNGLGVGSGGGMDIQKVLSMLHNRGGMAPSNPFQQGPAPTPMANYIGAPLQGGGMMRPPMMPPVAGNPAPQGFGAPGGGGTQGLMQLLAQLKGGQTGVAPTGNPNGQPSMAAGASPDVLAQQMAGNEQIGAMGSPTQPLAPPGTMNPAIMDWLRQMMAGGATPDPNMMGG